MDPIEKRELKRKAFAKLAAQRRRAGLLRGRVVVISLLCFAVLWGVVFAQMITGNDPVLSAKQARAVTRTGAGAKREIETTEPRELKPRRGREDEGESDGEEIEAEPEEELLAAETGELTGAEAAARAEAEELAALEAEEIAAIEAEEIAAAETAEAEALVTSQS